MRATELNRYVAALQRIRNLPIASIGRIAGIARAVAVSLFCHSIGVFRLWVQPS